ncbi:hypothetical protein D3C77_436890 [compost metagenome]
MILPDNEAMAIAQVVEIIVSVIAAAPYSDAVVVGFHTALNQLLHPLGASSTEHIVLRYKVGAHGKDALPVDFKCKRFSPLVLLLLDG